MRYSSSNQGESGGEGKSEKKEEKEEEPEDTIKLPDQMLPINAA